MLSTLVAAGSLPGALGVGLMYGSIRAIQIPAELTLGGCDVNQLSNRVARSDGPVMKVMTAVLLACAAGVLVINVILPNGGLR
jgi:hypothetical protein